MQTLVEHRYLLVIVYSAPKKYSYIVIYDSLHKSAHLNFVVSSYYKGVDRVCVVMVVVVV